MKVAIIVFPGSNCDTDLHYVLTNLCHADAEYVSYRTCDLSKYDAVMLPGGFSYGDYLRCGAIASIAPVMQEVQRFADEGKPVIGICNGFQILTEANILPGALKRNDNLKFICKTVSLNAENTKTPFTSALKENEKIELPIAHSDGSYYADQTTLDALENNNQVVFRYADENPNGSVNNIAGICNRRGNVVGMMPHPERASEAIMGGSDGIKIFQSLLS